MKTLTPNQEFVLSTLRARQAWVVAGAIELRWKLGLQAHMNHKHPARVGLIQKIKLGNKEASAS